MSATFILAHRTTTRNCAMTKIRGAVQRMHLLQYQEFVLKEAASLTRMLFQAHICTFV